MKRAKKGLFLLVAAIAACALHAQASDSVEFKVSPVVDGVYMLQGEGGNLALLTGEDGVLLVDNDYKQNAATLMTTLEELDLSAPDYVLNTHFHGDHTGSNQHLGELGSLIFAHENVRERLKEGFTVKEFNMVAPPASETALPVVTYDNGIKLHINGNHIQVIHTPNAHTDGDSVVYIKEANVIHTGDTLFNGFFPFIDVTHGGSVNGMIQALGLILEIADDNTKIIPGHGPLAGKDQVLASKAMLETAYKRLRALRAEDKTLDEAVAAKPLADMEEQWGGVIFTADQWIAVVYDGLD